MAVRVGFAPSPLIDNMELIDPVFLQILQTQWMLCIITPDYTQVHDRIPLRAASESACGNCVGLTDGPSAAGHMFIKRSRTRLATLSGMR
jgi:hypothetical protein